MFKNTLKGLKIKLVVKKVFKETSNPVFLYSVSKQE